LRILIKKSSEVRIEMSFEPSESFICDVLEILKQGGSSGKKGWENNYLISG